MGECDNIISDELYLHLLAGDHNKARFLHGWNPKIIHEGGTSSAMYRGPTVPEPQLRLFRATLGNDRQSMMMAGRWVSEDVN